MNKLVLILCLALLTLPAFAATQQEKMKTCNADATKKELKGDERKAFMKECLAAKKETTAPKKEMTPQQAKMKKCNTDASAKSLKGDDRKKFMSECMKAS